MPRSMSPAMLAAFPSPLLRPAIFVTATFVTGPVYLWTGLAPITWSGHTWLGVGSLLGISGSEDGATVAARGMSLSLSGIDASFLADAMQEFRQGLPVVVYLGLFDSSGALIADPLTSWAGRMDQPTVEVAAETAVITINCENRLLDMNVAVDRRYTQDDQQIDSPGDMGLQFVTGIQEINLYWGKTPTTTNNI